MPLTTVQPRLKAIDTRKVPTLEAKAGTTARIGGRARQTTRYRVLLDGGYACVDCGRVHRTNEVDHDVPLEQGGSNGDHNLRIRCKPCHAVKTAHEARARSRT